jgi:cytochrome c2
MLRSPSTKVTFATIAALLLAMLLVGAVWEYARERTQLRKHAAAITGGDARRGEAMFIQYGCGSCHALRRVRTATGTVGPPLDGVALRVIIGGRLSNTPANMQRWVRDPQHIAPGTAMPDLNVGADDARDITAFLYTRGK